MHIDNDDLIKFENGTMEEDELIEFLSHLDRCDFCLEQMMTGIEHSCCFCSRLSG